MAPEVLGVLFESVPGFEPCYLAFEPGLTVLYGLNGAGKTRTLDAISAIWAGRDSGAQLVVRLPEPELNDDPEFPDSPGDYVVSQLEGAIFGAWLPTEQLGFASTELTGQRMTDHIEQAYRMAITHGIGRDLLSNTDPFAGPLDPDRWDAIRDELLEQRLVLIRGAGAEGESRWVAQPLALADERFPVLSAEFRRIADLQFRLQQDVPAPYLVSADMSAEEQSANTAGFSIRPMIGPYGLAMGTLKFFYEGGCRFEGVGLELLSTAPPSDPLLRGLIAGKFDMLRYGEELLKPGLPELSDSAMGAVTRLQNGANNRLQAVLLDAPKLSLIIRPVSAWWDSDPLVWEFGPSSLPLTAMSRAELKWAHWAINEAVLEEKAQYRGPEVSLDARYLLTPASLLLLDEPEAALHRSAEAHMATALADVAAEPKRQIIAATHSPELLNLQSVRLIQVRKQGDGPSSLVPLGGVDLTALHDLGLNPSDLLRRQSVFLLVEGQHDELVFKTLIGTELDRLRVEILPLRGASKLPGTIESRLLFDFTDAHLFVVLDNLEADEVREIWSEAQATYLANDADVAGELLRAWAKLDKSSKEKEWLTQWLSRALEKGRRERVTPFGLRKADIIEYLPVERFVPNGRSWEALRKEHRQAAELKREYKDFKQWLTLKYKARFNPNVIVAAAEAADVPGEFMDLVSKIHAETMSASPLPTDRATG